MIIAINEQNEKWLAEDANKEQQFYCPVCNEKVVLKKGRKKMAHFAHFPNSKCRLDDLIREPESAEHIKIKYSLYHYLKNLGVKNVEVEKYFKEARSDVYFEVNNNKVVIEIQKSTLNPEIFKKRMNFYTKNNIAVIWIIAPSTINKNIKINDSENEFAEYHKYFSLKEWIKDIAKLYCGYIFTIDEENNIIPIRFNNISIYIEEKTVYNEDRCEYIEVGGYTKTLKQRKKFEILGKFNLLKDFSVKTGIFNKNKFLIYDIQKPFKIKYNTFL